MKRSGTLIVLSGPSGVGKSTLVAKVRAKHPELEFSVSCTTRAPRPGEEHGRHYFFLTREEFDRRLAADEFLEHATVFQNSYGTLKSEVLKRLRDGKDVLLDIDTQGARQIRAAAAKDEEIRRSAVFVMILPPSLPALEARLRGRSTETEEQLKLRISAAAGELARFREYDFAVVNDDLEVAARELDGLFSCFALRTGVIPGGIYD